MVFLHGLQGGSDSTWRHKDGTYWPDIIAADFPDLRVWTIGYQTDLVEIGRKPTIPLYQTSQIVGNLIHDAIGEHGAQSIVFIAHSMGGLVVKWLVSLGQNAKSKNAPAFAQIADRIMGVVFCGVPHRGADVASAARLLEIFGRSVLPLPIGLAFLIWRLGISRTIKELENNADTLGIIHDTFTAWVHDRGASLDVLSLIELYPYGIYGWIGRPFSTIIVPEKSAMLDFGEKERIPAHHIDLVKPSPAEPQNYSLIHARVARFLRRVQKNRFMMCR